MKIFENLSELEPGVNFPLQTSLTIGNFDGCHLGHQKLMRKALALADRYHAGSLAVTFEPHPRSFFNTAMSEQRLFTLRQKIRAFSEFGFKLMFIQKFDFDFSHVSHKEFYEHYLREKMKVKAIVVGDDFHFGFKRLGNILYLKERCDADQVHLSIESPEPFHQQPMSSSRIRALLRDSGQMDTVQIILGRPYAIEGIIEAGAKLGRTIGIPTANLGAIEQIIPASGVYAGYVWLESDAETLPTLLTLPDSAVPAVFNIGVRPTVDQLSKTPKMEAHLLSGEYGPESLYTKRACFYFNYRLREERKFTSLSELKSQIDRDIQQAKHLLA